MSDTPVNEEHVIETIRSEFRRQKEDIRFGMKRLTYKEICLGIIGIVFLSVWLYLSADSENVNLEILSIMGWVTVWEAGSIALMERPALWRLERNLDRLIRAEIRIHTAEQDNASA